MSSLKSLRDIVNHVTPGGYHENDVTNDNYYFGLTMEYFELLGKAIVGLKGHIRIESLAGELMSEMRKMWFRADSSRPADYPRKFTRGWLSNVP